MNRFEVFKNNKKPKSKTKLHFETFLGIPYYIILSTLIVLPVLILLIYSFQDSTNSTLEFTITFKHYISFFKEVGFLINVAKSLGYAAFATVITLLIGYPLAYLIATSKPRTGAMLITLVNAPMWINMLLRIRALKQVFNMVDPLFFAQDSAMIIGMIYIYLPFMVIPIYTVLAKMDRSLFESSADLGATRWQTIRKVVIPLSLSGVLSGIIMVFLPMATTLVIPNELGSSGLISKIIEESIGQKIHGGYGFGAAIAMVLALIILGLVQLMKKANKYQGGHADE